MKKLLLCFLTFLMISCVSLKEILPEKNIYSINLARFADKSFLITPENYNGDYLLISIYTMDVFPGAKYIKTTTTSAFSKNSKWIENFIDYNKLFDSIYDTAILINGNAFINFKLKDIEKTYNKIGTQTVNNPAKINGKRISGWIIKRQD